MNSEKKLLQAEICRHVAISHPTATLLPSDDVQDALKAAADALEREAKEKVRSFETKIRERFGLDLRKTKVGKAIIYHGELVTETAVSQWKISIVGHVAQATEDGYARFTVSSTNRRRLIRMTLHGVLFTLSERAIGKAARNV